MNVIYPYPTLHKDSLDYDNPTAYKPELKRIDKTAVQITHELSRDNVVAELVAEGVASFFCTVSVGGTIFRLTELTEILPSSPNINGAVRAEQKLTIPAFTNAMDIFARPGVVLREAKKIILKDASGISAFHKSSGSTIQFPAHAIIAYMDWQLFFSMNTLFILTADKSLGLGVFRAMVVYDPAFKIKIYMAPKLLYEVKNKCDGVARGPRALHGSHLRAARIASLVFEA